MEILKECHCIYLNCYESWNSFLNLCLLKIVLLFPNHENHLQPIFLPKNIAFLLSYFLNQHFLCHPFHSHCVLFLIFVFLLCQIKFFCILCKRSIVLSCSLVNGKRCITLETAKDLKTVILPSKVNFLMTQTPSRLKLLNYEKNSFFKKNESLLYFLKSIPKYYL